MPKEHAFMIWFRSPRTPIRARSSIAASKAGQMAASDYVPKLFKKSLASRGASTDGYTAQQILFDDYALN